MCDPQQVRWHTVAAIGKPLMSLHLVSMPVGYYLVA